MSILELFNCIFSFIIISYNMIRMFKVCWQVITKCRNTECESSIYGIYTSEIWHLTSWKEWAKLEFFPFQSLSNWLWGRGNSIVVSVSVYQAGDPGSRPLRAACHTKVRFYHCVIDSFTPVPTTGSKKAVHVLLCLCNNACKRSLAICRKSRASCPVSRLLSVPIWPERVKQER